MRFSLLNNVRSEALPKARGVCEVCGLATIAKCGSLVIHHWAHERGAECDSWFENEGPWHRKWKDFAPSDRQEVTVTKEGKSHRADVMLADGTVVELQHSPISIEDVKAREAHYESMIWLVDGTEAFEEGRLEVWLSSAPHHFEWSHKKRWWMECESPILIDLGTRVIMVRMARQHPKKLLSGPDREGESFFYINLPEDFEKTISASTAHLYHAALQARLDEQEWKKKLPSLLSVAELLRKEREIQNERDRETARLAELEKKRLDLERRKEERRIKDELDEIADIASREILSETLRRKEPTATPEEEREREIENLDLNLILGLPVDFMKGMNRPRALKNRRLLTPEERALALSTLESRLLPGFKVDSKGKWVK